MNIAWSLMSTLKGALSSASKPEEGRLPATYNWQVFTREPYSKVPVSMADGSISESRYLAKRRINGVLEYRCATREEQVNEIVAQQLFDLVDRWSHIPENVRLGDGRPER
ncbi:hypothetical protein, partial [Beijerinckia sp. L45]|uniref:hypothetical protein n=1 Tax=Beijerinckia sp. L45 TaxID=1641855 RepID=UPI00131EA2AF